MLILTRRPGEALYIGENIKVMVTRINGNQVKIGIQAPKEIGIVRDELVDDDSTIEGAKDE